MTLGLQWIVDKPLGLQQVHSGSASCEGLPVHAADELVPMGSACMGTARALRPSGTTHALSSLLRVSRHGPAKDHFPLAPVIVFAYGCTGEIVRRRSTGL